MRTLVFLSLSLALGAISLAACKQKKEDVEAGKAAVSQCLDEINIEIGKLQKATADIRVRFNAVREDLPGLETLRSKLFAVEEVMGVEGARVKWLSDELNAAVVSGNEEQIQKVSATIRGSIEGSKKLGTTVVDLADQLLPFERVDTQLRALADAGPSFPRVKAKNRRISARVTAK